MYFKEDIHTIDNSDRDVHLSKCCIHFVSSPTDLTALKSPTAQDPTVNLPKDVIHHSWPPYREQYPQKLWKFWNFRFTLVVEAGMVLKGNQIVVPKSI